MHMHTLFLEIDKFRQWAQNIPDTDRYGEWECDYEEWAALIDRFQNFLSVEPHSSWTDEEIKDILYIIARDNETEQLAKMAAADHNRLMFLAGEAIECDEPDAKWQLAVQLPKCGGTETIEEIKELLEQFVLDKDEYVNRRALIALAEIHSDKTDQYCQLAWERDIYGEMQEYQRIAVLHALFRAQSGLLPAYIALAKKDGRKYLLQNAVQLESECELIP